MMTSYILMLVTFDLVAYKATILYMTACNQQQHGGED